MMPANRTGAPERERPGPTRETGPLGKSAGTTHADSANDTPAGDTAQNLRGYLDAVYLDMTGVAHIALGGGPYLNDKGKYCFKDWTEHQFKWPDEADLVVREILRAAPLSDVYLSPYLTLGDKRHKSSAVARRLVHTDVDSGVLDPEKVRQLGGFAVASGSPGNGHAYLHLTTSVTVPQHTALCRALGAHLGAVDSKIVTSDVLRPVGSYNHKPVLSGGEPVPVRWLVRP
jgi:hypothetical protein